MTSSPARVLSGLLLMLSVQMLALGIANDHLWATALGAVGSAAYNIILWEKIEAARNRR